MLNVRQTQMQRQPVSPCSDIPVSKFIIKSNITRGTCFKYPSGLHEYYNKSRHRTELT
jgi:hypothetical protein